MVPRTSDRFAQRPRPDLWDPDEPMTLAEAAVDFFPDGPLSLSSPRTAVRNGELAVARVAGKILTTPRAIRQMTKPCSAAKPSRLDQGSVSASDGTQPGTVSIAAGKSAHNALVMTIAEMQAESRASLRALKAEARENRRRRI